MSETARPEGSATPAKALSQARAAGDEQAIDFTPGHSAVAGGPWEVTLEETSVQIGLLRLRWVDHEARRGPRQIAIPDMGVGISLESVNPSVTYSVTELLLLAPEN